jgi:hypothetical protein
MSNLEQLAEWIREHGNTCIVCEDCILVSSFWTNYTHDGAVNGYIVEACRTTSEARAILGY